MEWVKEHRNGDIILTSTFDGPINGGYAPPVCTAGEVLVLRDGEIVGKTTWQSAYADRFHGKVQDIEIVDQAEYAWRQKHAIA